LTIKFTRHTADCSASRRINSWRLPAHRTHTRSLGSRTPADYRHS